MKLWTIQPLDIADRLARDGVAVGDPDFLAAWGQEPHHHWGFRQAYDWMQAQMGMRLGPAPPGSKRPIWAWARPPHPTRLGAPDLRSMRDAAPQLLLELEVAPDEALFSDHGSWHHVLNGWPLTLSEREDDELRARLGALCSARALPWGPHGLMGAEHFADRAMMAELEATWTRIFDVAPMSPGAPAAMLRPPGADPEWMALDDVAVQACLWRLEPRHVTSSRAVAARRAAP